MKLSRLLLVLLIPAWALGCSTQFKEAGRQAALGAFEAAQGQINARIADVSARVDTEAARANAALEAKAPAIILQVRDALAPQINAAVTKGGDALQAALDAKILAAQAKRTGGEPMTPLDWFWIALGASGIGAGGIATGKAALRKLLGTTVPVDHREVASNLVTPVVDAVVAALTPAATPPKA